MQVVQLKTKKWKKSGSTTGGAIKMEIGFIGTGTISVDYRNQ